ncbi:hypothetical protein SAMN03159496_06477 [Rhizobium sp. NFR07]|uniref:hypothetical protein n=1 Tax=Rhizobium sp. NFR07 TaxID=1566262 RepID=UPI0008E802C6|nr:hypothetical protein [Rhizobium sp. NFR07]SFB64469.1 hypothetical protein SAMN03159496_06477 [Rhizobium sp. NFR07]
MDADGWDALDIPTDEPQERYPIEVMAGDAVRRCVEVDTPAFTYSSVDQLTDSGALPHVLDLRVRQMGRSVPFGIPAGAAINP